MNRFAVVAAVVLLGLSGGRASVDARVMPRPLQVLYVEASIAERWRLEEFPSRVGDSRFVIRSRAEYAFDKSPALEQALADSATRPDVIVLQECAALASMTRSWPSMAGYETWPEARILSSWISK